MKKIKIKASFPKKLLVVRTDDTYLMTYETPEDISEFLIDADQDVAVYELVTIGKFTVEKQVDGPPPKRRRKTVDIDNMGHQELLSYVHNKLRLKLYTKGMSTKDLRRHAREYLDSKK